MGKKIVVDPQKLSSIAGEIDGVIANYESLYGALYTNVSKLNAAWKGADNIAFTTQIEGFKDDFEKMKSLMVQYSDFLKKSSSTYQSAQNDIVSAASKLTN